MKYFVIKNTASKITTIIAKAKIGNSIIKTIVSTKAPINNVTKAAKSKYKLNVKTSKKRLEANFSKSTSFEITLPEIAARK